ncbi:hypothetical protein DFJ74DRAFT_684981 [Hyaloraphidium curvatum]|nr:hypothetical protein DFJ74DRAFT_684981 [Hyaloraphidium curvatum]
MPSRPRFGAIRPAGWLHARMRHDLDGFVGHLDALAPDILSADEIYGRDRLTRSTSGKDLGALGDGENDAQFLWWNSESQSNWRDGWLRHVLLVGSPGERESAGTYVRRMLATADAGGYIGISCPDVRFPRSGENGEFWALATLGRVLLAYADAGEDKTLAEAVVPALRRALAVVMEAWPIGGASPFPEDGYAGALHGLMLTDVLDAVAERTGDDMLRSYAAWLYRSYSSAPNCEPDAQLLRLLDPEIRFEGHGVHTYEHLRALLVAWSAEDAPEDLSDGLQSYLARLETCLTPAGGPIGDEWIKGRAADPTETGYELCSIQELLDSLLHLAAATDDLRWVDIAELTLLNAGMGAFHPELPAIAYLSTDNQVRMTGQRPGAPEDPKQTRYRYSPLHREAAVCCAPNAGRMLPTALGSAVLVEEDSLCVALFLPLEADLEVAGVPVHLEVRAERPGDTKLEVLVRSEGAISFELAVRKPAWAEKLEFHLNPSPRSADPPVGVHADRISVRLALSPQSPSRTLTVRFPCPPRIRRGPTGDAIVSHGPLLMTLPIPSRTTKTKELAPGFWDLAEEPLDDEHARMELDPVGEVKEVDGGVEVGFVLRGEGGHGARVRRRLVRMGTSALRRVTFPLAKHSKS